MIVRMGLSRMIIEPTSRSWMAKTPRPFPGLGRMVYTSGGLGQAWFGDCHDIVLVKNDDVEGIGRVDVAELIRTEYRRRAFEIILRF